MTWPEQIVLYISQFVSTRQTHCTYVQACILHQSKVIAQKLLATFDDVTWLTMLIAEVAGVSVDLELDVQQTPIQTCFDCLILFLHETGWIEIALIDLGIGNGKVAKLTWP